VLEDNAVIVAKRGNCKIIIDGDISIGSGVGFLAEGDAQLQIEINNTSLNLVINNAIFQKAAIIASNNKLTITGSDFTDGGIYGFNGDFDIKNTEFDNSFVYIADASGNENSVTISNQCSFTEVITMTYAVKIDDYPDFTIDDCQFENNIYSIYILNSGDGRVGGFISDCEITGNSQTAIQVYNTDVEILNNNISNNGYGLKILDNSNVKLSGSDSPAPTQSIEDNTWYEVFASRGSFPYYFHWNAIVDEDNLQPMVYYSGTEETILDVTNNYWGNNFNFLTDLYPSAIYDWDPVWKLNTKSASVAESLYESAIEKIELDDFAGAKTDLKEIVSDHYSSIYAQAALKKLYNIEKYDENDYASLKTYLANEAAIQQEEELIKLSAFLINFCEIKLENWQTAINWFENVIQEPELMEDSIFAIIDLGYTYLWMQNGSYKTTYSGTMTEHIPQSKEQFEDKRDYLLSLLPGDQLSEQMQFDISQLKTGELLQNVPNPFSNSTQLWYYVEKESNVVINIYDYSGKLISTHNEGILGTGHHKLEFNSKDLPSGIYFYNLEINGQVTDTKKMTLIR